MDSSVQSGQTDNNSVDECASSTNQQDNSEILEWEGNYMMTFVLLSRLYVIPVTVFINKNKKSMSMFFYDSQNSRTGLSP